MIAKEITYEELKKAIEIAFTGDDEIVALYDPNIEVSSVDDVIKDIDRKIFEIIGDCECKGIYDNEELIGYYVHMGKLLISFGLSSHYRKNNKDFFELIKKDLVNYFGCRLWSKNKRAINWLIKNEMTFVDDENGITRLIYIK